MADAETNPQSINRVQLCYKDKTLLISGGTGFMGKVLIEKILRTCPSVKKIYVLVRSKKGKNPQERLKEMFAGVVSWSFYQFVFFSYLRNFQLFDLLRKTRGDEILNKVVAIPGDVMELDLGLSPENRKKLVEEVEIIHNLAATIRFDDPLKKAVLLNTRGTKLMLGLAKECKHLKVSL